MRQSIIFAVVCVALLVRLPQASGQDGEFGLIDEQAWQSATAPIEWFDVAPDQWARFARDESRWYGDIDYLAMTRRDAVTFRHSLDRSRASELETGLNHGVRLRVNWDAASTAKSNRFDRPTYHFALLSNLGEGEVTLSDSTISQEASLMDIRLAGGTTTRVLGGQRRLMIGGTWTRLNDDYSYRRRSSGLTGNVGAPTDWIDTENSILTVDIVGEQQFLWHAFEFEIGFVGGVGSNQSTTLDRSQSGAKLVEQSYFATRGEIHAGASYHFSQFGAIHAGLSAVMVTDVTLARDIAADRDDPGRLEMVGMTLGYRHRF